MSRLNAIEVWRLNLADMAWSHAAPSDRSLTATARQSRRTWLGARRVLARRLGRAPDTLRFEHGEAGKPRLIGAALEFNIAHSGELALIALSAAPVGVDIERADPLEQELDDLARSTLCPDELTAWRAAPKSQRLSLFYTAWVRKEAYLKLTGVGLRKPMSDLRVADVGEDSLTVLDTATSARGPDGHLRDLDIASGFTAAVCSFHPSAIQVHTLSPQSLISDAADV